MIQPPQKKAATGYLGARIPRALHYRFMSAVKGNGSKLNVELIKFAQWYAEGFEQKGKGRKNPA